MAIDFVEDEQEQEFGFVPDEAATSVADVPELDDIGEALKANIAPDYEDRIRNSLHYARAFSLNPEAAFDLEPQLNEQLFGKSTLPENPAVLFKDAFKQSLADKPAMILKGVEVYTPGRALGLDSMLDKSATFLEDLNDPERKQELREVASGKLWPTGEGRRWWQVESRFVPEVINTWAVNVADQIPIMLATMAGRVAGKAIGKPIGALAGGAAAIATGGPDPSDVATAPAVVAITSEITKHLGGAAPLVAMEAGGFMDESENLEIDRDIAEKYARPYGLGSGAIEYAQQLWLLGRYNKISKVAQDGILRQVLGHIGGSLFEGVEEVSQQGLQNFLMQKAVADMKERHPDYQGEAPSLTEGLKRSGQIGAGVAFLTGLPGTGMSIAQGADTRMRDVRPETKKFLGEPSTQEQAQAEDTPAKPSEAAPPSVAGKEAVVAPAVAGEQEAGKEAVPAAETMDEEAGRLAEVAFSRGRQAGDDNPNVRVLSRKQIENLVRDSRFVPSEVDRGELGIRHGGRFSLTKLQTGEYVVTDTSPARHAPTPKQEAGKLPKEPKTLGPDVTGILGGVPREAPGLTKDEISHLDRKSQDALRTAQKKGHKVGFKQGAAETILDARRTMAALLTKHAINEKNKADLASIALTYLPKDQQGRFVRRILDLKTPKAAKKLTAKIRDAAETLIERQAVRDAKGELKKQIKRIPKFGKKVKLRQGAIEKIESALEDVDVTKLSKAKRAELEAVRDDLKQVGFEIQSQFEVPSEDELSGIKALVGEKYVKQLERLQKVSIADMTSEEIEQISDAIRYALNQNTKETQEQDKKKSEKVAQQNTESEAEMTPTAKSKTIDAGEQGIKITVPKLVYNFVKEDSLHRWALVESATNEGLNTTARVLDQDIHEGKNAKIDKEFEALEMLWGEQDRIGWTAADEARRAEIHTVKLGGKNYKATTEEIMSLGMNVLSDRNAKEIVRTENLVMSERNVNTPTIGEIVDAMDVLTDKERSMMDFVRPLNKKVLMPALNEVSEDFLGFSLATDPQYWGLRRVTEEDVRGKTTQAAKAIEDRGPFQEFTGSTLPIRIVPFWGQLLAQIQNVTAFYGLAEPMENARSMLNSKSWRKSMDAAGRKKEKENLTTLFKRMQGTITDRDSFDVLGSIFLGRSAKSILGWRTSTMAVQAASLPMAYTIIPDKYAVPLPGLTTQRGSVQSKRIDKDSPMLRLRHIAGRTNIVTGDASVANSVDNLIFRKPVDKSMEGMRVVDRGVMEEIDIGVQRWVADTTKLKVDSKQYWKEVSRRLEDVVRKTQPMWDVDERSIHGSSPNQLKRAFFIFRSAREAVLNQNIMAIDRLVKADDKGAATKHLANVWAATTLSTAMVVAIRTAMWTALGALYAGLTGRERPGEEDEPKDRATDFVTDMFKAMLEYMPLGRVAIGVAKLAAKRKLYDELDPDSILLGIPVATGKSLGHLYSAYQAYFEDGDTEKLKLEMLGAITDAADAAGRVKGVPVGGILQLTTQPLERALRENRQPTEGINP